MGVTQLTSGMFQLCGSSLALTTRGSVREWNVLQGAPIPLVELRYVYTARGMRVYLLADTGGLVHARLLVLRMPVVYFCVVVVVVVVVVASVAASCGI